MSIDEDNIRQWLDNFQQRLNSTQDALDKDKALMELLVKITHLMRNGNFKEAAYLRSEFDRLKSENNNTWRSQILQ